MPGLDPTHWLFRLAPAEWLAAADTEVAHAAEKLAAHAVRPGVTHARRAAGMAWNAFMAKDPSPEISDPLIARFGRSYMEHVVALASDDEVGPELRAAAAVLRDTPPAPPELVTLGKPGHPDLRVLEAARTIVETVRAKLG
jgi:hypothetical protein